MPIEKDYLIAVGTVAVATLDANGIPGPYEALKESVMVELDISAEYADNFSTERDSPNVQDLHCKIKNGPVGVSLTVKQNDVRTLQIALHGKDNSQNAGTVSDEPVPSVIIAGQQYFTDHPNVTSVVIVDSAGTPNELDEGTHYKVNEAGCVTFLDIDDSPAVKAAGNIHLVNQPSADETLTVGSKTYTFKVTATTNLHIQIGVDKETTATNIATRINTDTASTLCTAVPGPADVALTANTGGTAGNSNTLTVDGTHLTKTQFVNGEAADEFVQPFLVSYSYGATNEVGLLNDNPANVALRFDGKNLAPSPKKFLRALLKEVSFGPTSKFTLKSGSASGTNNTVNEYELKGVALDLDGSGYGKIETW